MFEDNLLFLLPVEGAEAVVSTVTDTELLEGGPGERKTFNTCPIETLLVPRSRNATTMQS